MIHVGTTYAILIVFGSAHLIANMRQSLQLRLGQQLTMTPQLQQAIRLLQLSSLDLQTEIQSILDSNLMLEKVDEQPELTSPADTTDNTDFVSLSEATELTSSAGTPLAEDLSKESPWEDIYPSEATPSPEEAELTTVSDSLPEDLPVDSAWEDIYDSYDGATSYSRNDEEQRDTFERQAISEQSLRDYLIWQMRLTPFGESDLAIATAIIDAVDESGYLTLPLEEIRKSLKDEFKTELDDIEAVLHRIQHFDPPGVAARNPTECLLLQLNQLPPNTPWLSQACALIQYHLDLLANRDFPALMRQLKVSREELQEIVDLIRSLNPHPGIQLSKVEPQYIVPDVFVYRHGNTWRVELNPECTPRLRINVQYAQLVRRADNSMDNLYLKNHLQEARWFLKSLQNRNETLLKVATCIVERQRNFLERGEEYMKPLVLRDIAAAMKMHESTISRVTTQKYMHTPRGIYEFKYFFSSHVDTDDGGECSSIAIRAMIKKLIAKENPQKPLSDSKIAQLLSKEGIKVARRTVAKYREVMSISSSTDRKRLT
jgi:RNA polymerase sigma-54 factor